MRMLLIKSGYHNLHAKFRNTGPCQMNYIIISCPVEITLWISFANVGPIQFYDFDYYNESVWSAKGTTKLRFDYGTLGYPGRSSPLASSPAVAN